MRTQSYVKGQWREKLRGTCLTISANKNIAASNFRKKRKGLQNARKEEFIEQAEYNLYKFEIYIFLRKLFGCTDCF
jgi:ABC-type uncharacterized transport system ATPase component